MNTGVDTSVDENRDVDDDVQRMDDKKGCYFDETKNDDDQPKKFLKEVLLLKRQYPSHTTARETLKADLSVMENVVDALIVHQVHDCQDDGCDEWESLPVKSPV